MSSKDEKLLRNEVVQAHQGTQVREEDNLKIYISMTTVPQRVHKISRTVDMLNNQTVKPTQIILNVPKLYKRFADEKIDHTILAAVQAEHSNFTVNEIDRDWGPITKLLPTLDLCQ